MIKTPLFRLMALLLILFVAACNQQPAAPTAVPEVNYLSFSDGDLGLTIDYPEDWIVHNAFGGLTAASSQEVIDAASLANIGDNGFVNFIPGELGIFNLQTGQSFSAGDAQAILGVYKQLLEREGQSYEIVEPVHPLNMDAQSAAMMVLRSTEDGKSLITILAVVINDDFMALISAASLEPGAAAIRPIFDHIISSTQVTAPEGLVQ